MTDLKPQSFSESALDKALDEIERLRADNTSLRAALRGVAHNMGQLGETLLSPKDSKDD